MTSSIGSILSIASSALRQQRNAIEITGHNLSNSATEGFTRQRVELIAGKPLVTAEGVFGSGVRLADVGRTRDALLDSAYRRETSLAAEFQERSQLLQRVEAIFNEPSDTGLVAGMDAFFSALNDLSTQPTSEPARIVVRGEAAELVDTISGIADGLSSTEDSLKTRVVDQIAEANVLLQTIADSNRDILTAEMGQRTAGDMRDTRDSALESLAELLDIRVIERSDGMLTVYADGRALVDGQSTTLIEVVDTGTELELRAQNSGVPVRQPGGRVGAVLELLNVDIPSYITDLDTLTATLVQRVNQLHEQGVTPLGNTGVSFFDPGGLTASSMALSADILADVNDIAAGTGSADTPPLYLPGANDIALALAGLREEPQAALAGSSFVESFGATLARLGNQSSTAQRGAQAHDDLAAQVDSQRSEISGVDVNQELLNLLRFQQAFGAAARLVTTADRMFDTILAM